MSNILSTKSKMISFPMKFSSIAGEKQEELITDYIPPFGEGKNFMPLELFLISLSTCLGGSISSLLKKMGFEVTSLDVNATGERNETHPTSFKNITFDIILSSPNASKDDLDKAISISEEKICPALDMIKGNVDIIFNSRVNI